MTSPSRLIVTCDVCSEQSRKYKCSTCLISICSLPCYKTHKSNPCNKPSELRPKLPVFPRKEIYNEYEESEESDSRLKLEQLDKIEKSSRIREFLKDDKLREIIGNIDNYANSTEPEKMLLQALQNDKMFYDFSQHILDIVLPQEDQSGDDAELENFFASDPNQITMSKDLYTQFDTHYT